jgi:hypothetical protein
MDAKSREEDPRSGGDDPVCSLQGIDIVGRHDELLHPPVYSPGDDVVQRAFKGRVVQMAVGIYEQFDLQMSLWRNLRL